MLLRSRIPQKTGHRADTASTEREPKCCKSQPWQKQYPRVFIWSSEATIRLFALFQRKMPKAAACGAGRQTCPSHQRSYPISTARPSAPPGLQPPLARSRYLRAGRQNIDCAEILANAQPLHARGTTAAVDAVAMCPMGAATGMRDDRFASAEKRDAS